MSTLPNFTGTGFFAGEAPDGLTTIAGTPTSAEVRVYWRDPTDPQAPDVLVASTQSAADGTWQIAGLNPALRYVVRAQKSQFDDVTVVGAVPARSDVIAYVNQLAPREYEFGDVDGLTGHVLLDSGLPPFTCEVIQPLPYGLTARIEGRKLLIEGVSSDNGLWESVVRVTASNGVWVDVPVQVQIQVLHDPHFDKVALLLHMDGVDGSTVFVDSSPSQKTVTPYGNAKISTDQSVFGGSSGFFSGSSNTFVSVPAIQFGPNEDFTIEGFMCPLTTSQYAYLCGFYTRERTANTQILRVTASSGQLTVSLSPFDVLFSEGIPRGVWGHFALSRSSGVLRAFYDGVLLSSKTSATSFFVNSVGAAYDLFGSQYIDEFRITKGVARYTANFTPPDKPFLNR